MTLYEINAAITDCVDAETGEVIDFERLVALNMEREAKLENIALWIKDLTAEAAAIKAEKMKLAERQAAAENKAESLKEFLSEQLGGQKFSTARCAVSFRRTKSVNVTDLWKIPEEYLKYSDPTPDKKALGEALKAGQTIEGAELVEKLSTIIK
jgi:hypothetical protein